MLSSLHVVLFIVALACTRVTCVRGDARSIAVAAIDACAQGRGCTNDRLLVTSVGEAQEVARAVMMRAYAYSARPTFTGYTTTPDFTFDVDSYTCSEESGFYSACAQGQYCGNVHYAVNSARAALPWELQACDSVVCLQGMHIGTTATGCSTGSIFGQQSYPVDDVATATRIYSTPSAIRLPCTAADGAYIASCSFSLCLHHRPPAASVDTCRQFGAAVTWSSTAADSNYVVGVLGGAYNEVYQCQPGTVAVRDGTGKFAHCQADFGNQCVQPTTDPAMRVVDPVTYCGGHGACAYDDAATRSYKSTYPDRNDLRMACTCTDGYTTDAAGRFCTQVPCVDQWGVAQPTCSGHGTCALASSTDAQSTCGCTDNYAGEACQWPGVLSERFQHFTARIGLDWVRQGTYVRGATVRPNQALYAFSLRSLVLVEPTSGVSLALSVQCPGSFALFGDTTDAATLRRTNTSAYLAACFDGGSACRLPFQRHQPGTNGTCGPPPAVASVSYGASTVYCARVTDPALLPAMSATQERLHCWTPPAFGVVPAASGASVLHVDCAFTADKRLFALLQAQLGGATWFHLHTYMTAAGCV